MAAPDDIAVRELRPDDRAWMTALAVRQWGAEIVVSRGRAHRVADLPGFVAEQSGERVGVATYQFADDECELVTLDALRQRCGVGTALVGAVVAAAGDRRLWLITTNENLDAMRFYQRRGFVLAAVYPGAIEQSRRIKPQIPRVGNFGIPIRDEIEFVLAR